MEAARIRTALEAGLAPSGLPGVTAAALTPSGETVQLAVGRRGADDPAPLTEDIPFWIASMTKAVTAVVALQLVAEGRIGLDEPVGERLPELAAPQVLEGLRRGREADLPAGPGAGHVALTARPHLGPYL
jgi:CubicO group peptidase (beta-lactamase class C family)